MFRVLGDELEKFGENEENFAISTCRHVYVKRALSS